MTINTKMNKIKDIEKLRQAVIKRHYKNYYECMSIWQYRGDNTNLFALAAEVDRKVLYYVQLGITAEELDKK